MIIGNLPNSIHDGVQLQTGKWYVWIEIRKCPPHMINVLKPSVSLGVFKVVDEGEPWKIDGKKAVTKGFFKRATSPFGIAIEIIK